MGFLRDSFLEKAGCEVVYHYLQSVYEYTSGV